MNQAAVDMFSFAFSPPTLSSLLIYFSAHKKWSFGLRGIQSYLVATGVGSLEPVRVKTL